MNDGSLTPHEVDSRRTADPAALLIDVRTPAEFAQVHAQGARSMPLDGLDPAEVNRVADGHPVFLICKAGPRSAKAQKMCQGAGLSDVHVVAGGTAAWELAGLPVVRGPSTMSLERQVRIVAGSLVLLSIILGWHVHPAFLFLGLFVGAGQIYSGISDTCGMGMLLAKMPWNRRGTGCELPMTQEPMNISPPPRA